MIKEKFLKYYVKISVSTLSEAEQLQVVLEDMGYTALIGENVL